jgi:hypothetical protein
MLIKAAINGARTRAEHPAIPLTTEQPAAEGHAAVLAGAGAIHVHVRDALIRESSMVELAAKRGYDTRTGFEDILTLPRRIARRKQRRPGHCGTTDRRRIGPAITFGSQLHESQEPRLLPLRVGWGLVPRRCWSRAVTGGGQAPAPQRANCGSP